MIQTNTQQVSDFIVRRKTTCLDLFSEAQAQGFGDIHFKSDPANQLQAIIAIHSTKLGPAAGGCRCRHYATTDDAIEDALRLARGMSYKAALAGLPSGGGKAVLILPDELHDREAFFESFGAFVESLGGRYLTAVDSGTSPLDMDIIARRTRHVLGASRSSGGSGDPSPTTARGVRMGIEAAVRHLMKRDSLEDIHVAIQGLGHVGYPLARELHAQGARLTVADTHSDHVERCVDEFNATPVAHETIYSVECDVYAPCALGAVINDETIKHFNTRIIAGAANNQLAHERHGNLLHERGILYVPDYVINAGGLIHVLLKDQSQREERLLHMIHTLTELFEQSSRSGIPPFKEASIMAEEILYN
ncbi:MAG: amino acid dehydrogenase [Candidatus Thiodiazotropha sp.]